jgi:peptidyl-dipeptidase A
MREKGPAPAFSARLLCCVALSTLVWPAAFARAQGTSASGSAPTAQQAAEFVARAEERLLALSNAAGRAQWVQATYITEDTEKIAAAANKDLIAASMELAQGATRFDAVGATPEVRRKLTLLKLAANPLPAPSDPKLQTELTEIMTSLEGMYGRGKYCKGPGTENCLDVGAVTKVFAESRDPDELKDVWRGWHSIAPPMKPKYQRFVELANQGARELRYPDLGALWRSSYDMPPDEFAKEVDRLWGQVRPLYESLHAHVRASLVKQYGRERVPETGPIPAHLLGNIWAQQWGNIYPLVGVQKQGTGYDLDAILKARKTSPDEMVRYGERFFTSLGLAPLDKGFWERSQFTKPRDREVVCHASAWDLADDDFRIKMCIEPTSEDFITIHHELGHVYYYRQYRPSQPFLFRGGANDGFHEAIGDAIALSVTPGYLVKAGLLDKAPGTEGDLEFLMKMALDKVAFLPFGLLVDQWRWKVFAGEVKPGSYNAAWWELRRTYQGVEAPLPRSEADFDPGAKYHVPANVPYTRYFLAHILQFQFHRALCREAGFQGPLYQCSIYDNKAAGARLQKMLELGLSRPWPDALEAVTGERKIDATAILDYFAPLKKWLDEQNKGRQVGW